MELNQRKSTDPVTFFGSGEVLEEFWVASPKFDTVFVSNNSFEKIDETFYTLKDRKMDHVYLRMADVWATNSRCNRMKVGSLIVRDKSIISDGYNGSPTGFSNDCEDGTNTTLSYVLHAEANAITKLAKSTQSSDGSTLYVTVSPCFECSKLIIQSGIKRLVFRDLYRKVESLEFLFRAGIEIVRIGKN
jgi:dCMP deaminase